MLWESTAGWEVPLLGVVEPVLTVGYETNKC